MQIDNDLEKKMNKIGLFIKDPSAFELPPRHIGVQVELGVPKDVAIELPNIVLEAVTKRGVSTYFSGFKTEERGDLKVLSFEAIQQVPASIWMPDPTPEWMATSFLDLCWFVGNEAINSDYSSTTLTPLRDGTCSSDLGYYLPARFLDSFIDAMGKINDVFFSGALEDAMVYGTIAEGAR